MISYIIVAYLLGLVPMYIEAYEQTMFDYYERDWMPPVAFISCCLIVTFWPITLPLTLLFLRP